MEPQSQRVGQQKARRLPNGCYRAKEGEPVCGTKADTGETQLFNEEGLNNRLRLTMVDTTALVSNDEN